MTGLDYLGVDLVLDRDKGPLLLELNSKPGLAIQIANVAGLGARFRRVEESGIFQAPLEERVAFARREFADTGRQVMV